MKVETAIYSIPEQEEQLKMRFGAHKALFTREVLHGVLDIFDRVGADGDEGVKQATRQFDGVSLDALVLPDSYAEASIAALEPALREAVEQAIRNVREVNEALLPVSWKKVIREGTTVGEKVLPLDRVGIWIPARKGPLLSTAIMLVSAAKAAGVSNITVGMPPRGDGYGDPGTVAAARLAGADRLVVGNGVAVIAAFAQGTSSIPEVDGIFGPGPGGIAAAMSVSMTYGKKSVLGIGPTESMILADESADPRKLAYDLANEAEHGPDSTAILVTTSSELARQTAACLQACIEEADERRKPYLEAVFGPGGGKGAIVVAPDIDRACEFVNGFAPEHLMICCESDAQEQALALIRHAGEILIGEHTPFSAANYAIGITAVLPTNHYARAFSGVTAKDMVKMSTIGSIDNDALAKLFPVIEQLGTYEQLPGHVKAAAIRLEDQRKQKEQK